MSRLSSSLVLLAGLLAAGCAAPSKSTPLLVSEQFADVHVDRGDLDSRSIEELADELAALRRSGGWQQRGVFSPQEHDELERLYAAYLWRRRASLKQIERARSNVQNADTESFVTAVRVRQIACDARLAASFCDDPIATRKLNEAFHRSRIAPGSFNRIVYDLTARDTIRFVDQTAAKASPVVKTVSHVSPPARMDAAEQAKIARQYLGKILQQRSAIIPAVMNDLDHATRLQQIAHAREAYRHFWSDLRAKTIVGIGSVRYTNRDLLKFSADQKQLIRRSLLPGDVLLTYTAGYVRNVVFKGKFKHTIVYVGSAADRRRVGLDEELLRRVPEPERTQLRNLFAYDRHVDGTPLDMIESVTEGVVFNSLDKVLDTRVSAMVVLRPVLSDDERQAALASVFAYVGSDYDFYFNFGDASDLVCTELFYAAYNGKGDIQLQLTRRWGRDGLGADDIIAHHLSPATNAFEAILLAEPIDQEGTARLVFGWDAEQRLRKIMKDE